MNPAPPPRDPHVQVVWQHLAEARAEIADRFPPGIRDDPSPDLSAEERRWSALMHWLESRAVHDLREIDALGEDAG
jgi:hypothetical protein